MSSIICGAKTKRNTLCNRPAVVGSKRCSMHGAYSTGPRSLTGKLRCGDTLRRYRINGPGKGHKKGSKARLRREARIAREKALPERLERKRQRLLRWQMKQRESLGLPLLTEVEIENFGANPENKD